MTNDALRSALFDALHAGDRDRDRAFSDYRES